MPAPDRTELEVIAPQHGPDDVRHACTRAKAEALAAVVVFPADVALAVRELAGTRVAVVAVAGYPLGVAKPTVRAIEASSAVKDKAAGVEVTPRLSTLLAASLADLRDELTETARAARAANPDAVLRLDLTGAATLSEPQSRAAIDAALQSGFDGLVVPPTLSRTLPDPQGLHLKVRTTSAPTVLPPTVTRVGLPYVTT